MAGDKGGRKELVGKLDLVAAHSLVRHIVGLACTRLEKIAVSGLAWKRVRTTAAVVLLRGRSIRGVVGGWNHVGEW